MSFNIFLSWCVNNKHDFKKPVPIDLENLNCNKLPFTIRELERWIRNGYIVMSEEYYGGDFRIYKDVIVKLDRTLIYN